ncbi:hypothetical protein E4U43_001266 [Claviceps pusilla]|uniref:Uncharacterized protein n=1 Tax=Claviceps pusilla TaxID=123648 RepID=A0A9P7NAI9_9HYPO|nr:hypothetical protein E4U43_001266 [Claviceps pusilla]
MALKDLASMTAEAFFENCRSRKRGGRGEMNSEGPISKFSDMESIFGAGANGSRFQGAGARAGAKVG